MNTKLMRKDLLYPELSYKIVGCAFDVYNEVGGGHHEKYYQRALAKAFLNQGLKFEQEVYYPLRYQSKVVGKKFLDFLVEDVVVVETKKGDRYSKRHIDQVLGYLETTDKKLAILINFGSNGVTFKRIINFKTINKKDS